MTESIESLQATLSGSPYVFHDDAPDSGRARRFLAEYQEVLGRVRRAREVLSAAAEEARERLARTFGIRLVYESNQLERLGPDLGATAEIVGRLQADPYTTTDALTDVVKDEPQIIEVIGLHRAHDFAQELADEIDRPLSEVDLRELHTLILPHAPFAGQYKDRNVEISEARHEPVDLIDTAREMYNLARWVRESSGPAPLVAAGAHAWLTHVHPFRDGNGRLARLLANYVLLRSAWPPLIVRGSLDRGRYLDALAASDEGGDIIPLAGLFLDGLRRSADDLLNPERVIGAFQEELLATHEESYSQWLRRHHDLESRLRVRLNSRGISFEPVGELSLGDFTRLAARDTGGNGWYAKVSDTRRGLDLLVWFGFYDDELHKWATGHHRFPSYHFSERDFSTSAVHPYRPMKDTNEFGLDEVALSPSLMGDPVIVRAGSLIRRLSMDDGAEAIVQAIEEFTS